MKDLVHFTFRHPHVGPQDSDTIKEGGVSHIALVTQGYLGVSLTGQHSGITYVLRW